MANDRNQTLAPVYQGETVVIPFEGTTDPAAMSLRFVMGDDPATTTPDLSVTSITTGGPSSGVYTISVALSAAETAALAAGEYEFQLWNTASGSVEVLAAGTVEVRRTRKG